MSKDYDDEPSESSKGGRIPDAFRKAFVSGLSALFVTEENVRNLVSDLRLPKDAMNYVVQQTDKTRREMFRVVAHEVKTFLRDADVTGEMRRALSGLNVQIRAEVKFSEDKPDVSLQSRVKKRRRRSRTEASPPAAATGDKTPEVGSDAPPRDKAVPPF